MASDKFRCIGSHYCAGERPRCSKIIQLQVHRYMSSYNKFLLSCLRTALSAWWSPESQHSLPLSQLHAPHGKISTKNFGSVPFMKEKWSKNNSVWKCLECWSVTVSDFFGQGYSPDTFQLTSKNPSSKLHTVCAPRSGKPVATSCHFR